MKKNNNFKPNKKGFSKFLIWLLVAIIIASGVYFIITFNQAKANAEIKELVDLNNTLYTEIEDLRDKNSKLGSDNLAFSELNNDLTIENERLDSVLSNLSDNYVISVLGTYYKVGLGIASAGVSRETMTSDLPGEYFECQGSEVGQILYNLAKTDSYSYVVLYADMYTRLSVYDVENDVVTTLDYVSSSIDLEGKTSFVMTAYDERLDNIDSDLTYKLRLDLEITDESDDEDGSVLCFFFRLNVVE